MPYACCSTYTPTWQELSGINGPAEDLILKPAASLLLSDSDLLDELRNATLVKVCLASTVLTAPDAEPKDGFEHVHAEQTACVHESCFCPT